MSVINNSSKSVDKSNSWQKDVAVYMRPDIRKSLWQLVTTIVPYLLLWTGMVFMIRSGVAYGWILIPAVLAGLFMVRTFILFHDCCHGSFFNSARANRLVGYLTGILSFAPYEQWRSSHNKHHATSGDLDRRGMGDVWTMTVSEYRSAPWFKRLAYRIFRHPMAMFGIGPLVLFLISMRVSQKGAGKKEKRSVWITNLSLAVIITAQISAIGLKAYLLIQMPVMFVAGVVGIWLFYVQHQYEDVYWSRNREWDFTDSALLGSSHYQLPKVLQWMTGNIGLHHIHHLRPRIPNYNLQICNDAIPPLQVQNPLTLGKSFKSLWLDLWDEEQGRLVSFRAAR